MVRRLILIVLVGFWVTMTTLLWRSEIGGAREAGAVIPASVVWEKILTAPDDSMLELSSQGKKLGYLRWIPSVGKEMATGKRMSEEYALEGMVEAPAGYEVTLEGTLLLADTGGHVRINGTGKFGTNHLWRELMLKGTLKPTTWEVHAKSSLSEVTFKMDDGEKPWKKTLRFSDFSDPKKLMDESGVELPLGLLAGLSGAGTTNFNLLNLKWEARTDWLQLGHSQVRVYRLKARIIDRYEAVVIVSRVGEILRLDLPGDVHLVSDVLLNL